MPSTTSRVRLRQAVLVASDLEQTAAKLRATLGLGEPFRDPGVGAFGLANVVFALGDCFIEVVSPIQAQTAAGRQLQRRGEGGYMVIFDIEGKDDFEGARSRALALGVRAVWQIELGDIATTHLHPADMRGAIVSIDRSEPYGSWRWGGPRWTGSVGVGAAGELAGVSIAVADPAAVAARWGEVLGVAVSDDEQPTLDLEDAWVRFETAASEREEGMTEIAAHLPQEPAGGWERIVLGGVSVRRVGISNRLRSQHVGRAS
jgi:Glyoxalase-like domain